MVPARNTTRKARMAAQKHITATKHGHRRRTIQHHTKHQTAQHPRSTSRQRPPRRGPSLVWGCAAQVEERRECRQQKQRQPGEGGRETRRDDSVTQLDACYDRIEDCLRESSTAHHFTRSRTRSMLQQDDRCSRPPRVVLHVDLDAFFVQVERKLNPTLIGACDYSSLECGGLSSVFVLCFKDRGQVSLVI